MDLVALIRSYVERMLADVPGMKVLLLDAETTKIVSTVYSQSEILEQEVYLVEKLDDEKGDQLFHLKAVCFLRPSRDNIARLRRELRDPRFGEYHLFFTNLVEDMRLRDLAEMDAREMVREVHEAFGDFVSLDPHHFAVPLPRPHVALQPLAWDYGASADMVARVTEGLSSLVLALRRRVLVRYQRGSEVSERCAQSLHHLTSVEERELFDFGARGGGEAAPLLLVLDRRDDPVTPLLSQWTYQAMVHELLGLQYNRVDLRDVPGVKPEASEAVLSASGDPFFASNMYANFGDLGMAIKALVDDFSREARSGRDFATVEDMASFMEGLPEHSVRQGAAAKHVALMSELSRLVEQRLLMQVSGVEQELVCQAASLPTHTDAVGCLLRSAAVDPRDKLRLAALYGLRYERDGKRNMEELLRTLESFGIDSMQLAALRALLRACAADRRVGDLFSDRSITSRFATLAKQHIKGVENVYTQHTPPLVGLLERAAKGKLPELDYPRLGREWSPTAARAPRLIVAFIVGGTTYEEARAVAELNAAGERGEGWSAGVRLLLGGTGVQNSASFLKDWGELALGERHYQQPL